MLIAARERTQLLTGSVDEGDLIRQHSPLMSPLVWDLAHIANQEELWLLREVGGREPMHPEIDPLYDAFEHPRAERPTLPLLPPGRGPRATPARSAAGCSTCWSGPTSPGRRWSPGGFAFGMIAQHEQQHDETMLITHQLRRGAPVLAAPAPPPAPADAPGCPPRCSSPAARSPWAPRPSRGRWTTNGPPTRWTCPPSTSTPRR